MVVYLDLLFLLNFTANYLLLLGTGRLAGSRLFRWRIAIAAAAGAAYSAVCLLRAAAWLLLWPCKLLIGTAMVLISYGGEKRFLRVVGFFFASSAALAGVLVAAQLLGAGDLSLSGGQLYSDIDFRLLLLLFVVCYFVMSLFFRGIGNRNGGQLVNIEIGIRCKKVALTALIDSGHTLTDPISNKPVVVTEYCIFRECMPGDVDPSRPIEGLKRCRAVGIEGVRLIPYRAVGVDCGLLLALKANSVTLEGKDQGSLLVAFSPTPVSSNGTYHALIGGV